MPPRTLAGFAFVSPGRPQIAFMTAPNILIVEDEAIVALDLRTQLEDLGYGVAGVAASGEAALSAVLDAPPDRVPDLVLMDVRLQGALDGIETAAELRRTHDTPVIFLTAHSDNLTVQRAAATAPYGFVTKPYQVRELRAGIEVALAKHRLERQLQEADRWFAHTLRCVQDGIVLLTPEHRLRFMNPAAEALLGASLEGAAGKLLDDLLDADNTEPCRAFEHALGRSLDDGRAHEVGQGLALRLRDGRTVQVDSSAGPVRDDADGHLGTVLVLRDAGPRLAQEQALRASEARFRSAFDHAPLGMALVAHGGAILQANTAMCALLGATHAQLTALSVPGLTPPEDAVHESERLHQMLAQPTGVVSFEKRWRRLDGRPAVWTLVSVSLLHGGDSSRDSSDAAAATGGAPGVWLYQVHDLTEQKAAAERLAALAEERLRREASELASQAKSDFLSRVSHEMRTPLNAVLGFAQLLQMADAPAADKVEAYAGHIRNAGEHLLRLVNDLLDLQRTAQGGSRIELERVELAPLLEVVRQFLGLQAAAQEIVLHTRVAPELTARADPMRLKQVLLNLGSNAIKYNRAGGNVRFGAEATPDGRVRVTVQDDGIGMTAEQLTHLFEPFQRLGQEKTNVPGSGLGLAISRGLVLEMGGTLDVQSQPRGGTVVSLVLDAG